MGNPYSKILLNAQMRKGIESVKRIDEKGQLYYMDYTGNYYGGAKIITKIIKLLRKNGCSAFITKTPEGQIVTGRNYDMPHLNKQGDVFGVNMVVHCHPEGKYESLAGTDSVWLGNVGFDIHTGCFDDGKTSLTGLALIPYICMDGINEKGFTVSILALDVKPGEKPVLQKESGKQPVIITELVRYMLDNCDSVEHAIEFAGKYNLINTLGNDYHLFITDSEGNAAVLEWRHDTYTVTRTDACTNFYVGYDDAEDCIYKAGLKEKWVAPEISYTKEYHYGYGHGYERGKTVRKTLEEHRVESDKECSTVMTKEEARNLLAAVAQDHTNELTSFTQYSVLYDNNNLTADYYVQQDYEHRYSFNVHGEMI